MFSNENGLIKEAKKSKVLPNIIVCLLWVMLFLGGGEVIGLVFAGFTRKIIGNNPAVLLLNDLVFGFVFITLLVFARVKFREKREISSMGLKKEGFIKKYLIGFGIGILMFSIVVLLLSISGHIIVDRNPVSPTGILALSGVLIVLPGWMIQSATEEILSRGWFMNILSARYNVAVGLIVSSAFFGIIHLGNPNVSILAIFNILNWTQGNIFGFEVSGQKVASGSLMSLKLTGAEWVTGGGFGPEAGMVAALVLSIGIIIVYFIPLHKSIENVEYMEN